MKKVLYLVFVFIGSSLGMMFVERLYHDSTTLGSHLTQLVTIFNWLLLVICVGSAVILGHVLPDILLPQDPRKKEPSPQLLLTYTKIEKASNLKLVIDNVARDEQLRHEFNERLPGMIERGKAILDEEIDTTYVVPYLTRVK